MITDMFPSPVREAESGCDADLITVGLFQLVAVIQLELPLKLPTSRLSNSIFIREYIIELAYR